MKGRRSPTKRRPLRGSKTFKMDGACDALDELCGSDLGRDILVSSVVFHRRPAMTKEPLSHVVASKTFAERLS